VHEASLPNLSTLQKEKEMNHDSKKGSVLRAVEKTV
jgi:hypothetical protein